MQTVNIPMEDLVPLLLTQLDAGGRANLTVTGSSMLPMLRHRRDQVALAPLNTLRKTDIILYRRENGTYILHRIVRCEGADRYICSGDNQWEAETVCREQILAVVTDFTRNGKTRGTRDRLYRLYAGVWTWLFPIRRPVIGLRRTVGRLRARWRKGRRKT